MKELPIYAKQTVEFATVAAEYCAFIEKARESQRSQFVDKCVKLLPLLYLKALLLPAAEFLYEETPEKFVTEESYEYVRSMLQRLMGQHDDYLEVFSSDMQFSEEPVTASVAEDLTDIYQDLKDFISVYSLGYENTMNEALALLEENFKEYWSQKLVNVLRPLNTIHFGNTDDEEEDQRDSYEESKQNSDSSNWMFDAQRDDTETDDNEFDKWNG